MRIVAGRFRGRPLAAPGDEGIRPTSDRVRESVFNILAHGLGDFSIEGRRVIDLFAGTGALGIEALSRGASYCLFVEEAPDARALIRRNVEASASPAKRASSAATRPISDQPETWSLTAWRFSIRPTAKGLAKRLWQAWPQAAG